MDEEVAMRSIVFRAPASGEVRSRRGRFLPWFLPGAVLVTGLALGGFAQMSQPPNRPPKPMIAPEANPTPDANEQMAMRQRKLQNRNFDLANAERRRQMIKASNMLETMAIALNAEVDKPGPASENEIQKAETIEKLAHMVKERMTLTVTPN
jgi:hypothetical protein